MVDKIDNLNAFAIRVRNHFLQWYRCRSRVIKCVSFHFRKSLSWELGWDIGWDDKRGRDSIHGKEQTAPFEER